MYLRNIYYASSTIHWMSIHFFFFIILGEIATVKCKKRPPFALQWLATNSIVSKKVTKNGIVFFSCNAQEAYVWEEKKPAIIRDLKQYIRYEATKVGINKLKV